MRAGDRNVSVAAAGIFKAHAYLSLKSGAALIRVEASNNFDMKLKRRHLITGVVVGLSCFFFHTPALPPK